MSLHILHRSLGTNTRATALPTAHEFLSAIASPARWRVFCRQLGFFLAGATAGYPAVAREFLERVYPLVMASAWS
jgi:hypothetical protein